MEEENLQNNEEEKNNKVLIIVIIVAVIAAIVGALFATKVINFENDKNDDKPIDNTNTSNDTNNNESVAKNGTIDVYCRANFDDCWLTTIASEGGKLFYTIETESANPTVLDDSYNIILFDDNGLKVFIGENKSIKKINLENEFNSYKNVSFHSKFVGIIYENDNISGYYDYKTDKIISDNSKLLNDAFNERYILYLTNNNISIYDKNDSKVLKEKINLDLNYTEYRVINEYEQDKNGVSFEKNMIGIFAINESNGNTIFYNSAKNKTMYKNSYSNIYLEEHNDYLIGQKGLKTGAAYDTVDYILDPNEEKIILEPSNPKKHMSFYLEKYNGKYYFIESTDLVEPHYYTKGLIYSNNKKLIAEVKYHIDNYRSVEYMLDEKGYLFIKKDNTINKYNIDGELLHSNTYAKVINMCEGYLIVVNDGKLLIEDSNFKQLAEVVEWKDSYKFDDYPPAYLIEDSLSEKPNNNFVEGIYMVLEDGNNYTEYCFNPKDNKITSRKISNIDDYDLSTYWADLS